jgi:DNA invertase Pin-like site-specific DNA recombinase
MKPRAFSYLRMSTAAQLAGDSLRRQLAAARDYADKNGLDLQEDDQLRDIGVSAFKGANVGEGAALGEFMAAVRTGRVPPGSVLLVEDLDRLSRQAILKSVGLLIELLTSGITIATLSNGRTYTAASNSGDLILSIISMERAYDESRMKQVRSLAVWKNKREGAHARPLTKVAPKWLQLSTDRSHFEVIKERAAIVRRIFEESASGLGIFSIAERLNREGVRPFGGTRGPGRGWHCSYISKILSNRAVLGEMQPCECIDRRHRRPVGEPVTDYYPRIIDDELFFRARAGLNQRRGGGGRKGTNFANIFAGGMLRCAYCKFGMIRENKGRKGRASFRCGCVRIGIECARTRWSCDDLETSFLSFVSEIDLASIIGDDHGKGAEIEHRIVALRGKLAELDLLRDRTFETLQKTTDTDYVARKLNELKVQRTSIENDLHAAEAEKAGLESSRLDADEMRPLIDRIRASSGGDDVYRLRSAVASRLRSIIDTVLVAPEGSAPMTRKTIEFLRGQDRAEDVIEHLERTMDHRRHFVVVFRSGSMRAVCPDANDPSKFTMQLTHSRETGLVRYHPDEGPDVVFPPGPTREGRGGPRTGRRRYRRRHQQMMG